MVLCFHARSLISGPDYLDLGDRLFINGAAGVDLFFVISGFIMVYTTRSSDGSIEYTLGFFCKRLARIWPVYFVLTLVYLLATGQAALLASAQGALQLAKSMAFYPIKLHSAPIHGYPPLVVGWTLNYEVWFYALFGLSLLAGRWRWHALSALFATFLIGVPLLLTGQVHIDAYAEYGIRPAILDLAANPLIWDFVAGVVIGLLYVSKLRIRDRSVIGSLVAIAAGLVLWQWLSGYRAGYGPLRWGLAAALVVLALAFYNKEHSILVPRWARWLGDVSFSLYLVHRITQIGLPHLLKSPGNQVLFQGLAFFVANLVAALVLAHWSHRWLERGLAERVRRWLLARLPSSRRALARLPGTARP